MTMNSEVVGSKKMNGAAKPAPVKIVDQVQLGLIGVYLVQKLRRPTIQEIQKVAEEKLNCSLHAASLRRALVGASRANLIAVLQDRHPDTGNVVEVFSMKDPQRW